MSLLDVNKLLPSFFEKTDVAKWNLIDLGIMETQEIATKVYKNNFNNVSKSPYILRLIANSLDIPLVGNETLLQLLLKVNAVINAYINIGSFNSIVTIFGAFFNTDITIESLGPCHIKILFQNTPFSNIQAFLQTQNIGQNILEEQNPNDPLLITYTKDGVDDVIMNYIKRFFPAGWIVDYELAGIKNWVDTNENQFINIDDQKLIFKQ